MTDGIVQVAPDSTGKKVDASELTVGANTVERQRIVLASDGTAAGLADVTNAQPASTAYGLPVRPVGDGYVALNAASITAAAVIGGSAFDTSGYQSFNFQITGTFSATVLCEESNDNTNWSTVFFYNGTSGLSNFANTSTTGVIPHGYGSIKARYFRMRCSAFTSNTSSAVTLVLRTGQVMPEFVNINAVTGSVTVTPSNSASSLATGTTAFVKSAATTNATRLKASAGNLLGITLSNTSAAAKYVKFYNKASAPTVGTDTPVCLFAVPAGGTVTVDGSAWAFVRFTTGIAYAITGAATDADTTAVAVNDVSGWITYA